MNRRKFLRRGAGAAAGAALTGTLLAGCDSFLEPEVHSQLAPTNIDSASGYVSVLASAYTGVREMGNIGNRIWTAEESTTDIAWETGGGYNRDVRPFINFTWNSTTVIVGQMWGQRWGGIRDSNVVLDNLGQVDDLSGEMATLLEAEARFVRAVGYAMLYNWFGPVPLRTTTNTEEQPINLPRATDEEIRQFIETELSEVVPQLPEPGQEPVYGRANSGAARAYLAKFYLQTKQWQEAADMAQEVIGMEGYALYPDYLDMFKVENETNDEYIWVWAASVTGPGNEFMNGKFPPGFQRHPRTGLTWQGGWNNWARQDRILDGFYNSFDSQDERREPIIEEYVNANGETVQLVGSDNARSFKFWPDPDASGNAHGNDYPTIRYADILLSRAEALNELQGPNQESIDLVNQVRDRAGLEGVALGDFASKDALREYIVVKERGWEFYTERKRRKDLIRIGKFVEFAQERGLAADSHHQRFPIPQSAMDANPELEQNPGYGSAS